ncbi:CLUMA_CG017219, isoform A [Clunio marinus]|uniref:CLUMA_CG017219, isoform A n=1 Tax=Clunio marinus TaxID=568069 RepID=A0A1J1IWP1_9DIPT|nr:CLUMA_CG017219, isoform A [Clunio marinus]
MNLLSFTKLLLLLCTFKVINTVVTIIEIETPKDLKKAIATKTNLLILFSNNGKDTEIVSVKNLLKSVDGSFASVDCSKRELKKVCKKSLPEGTTYVLKHYKDGTFNKDYDRQMTKTSLQTFMRDPTGDIPFEEDPSSVDVVHVSGLPQLKKLLGKEKNFLMMFYTNWCGYCKKLKPHYASAATEVKGKHVIAAMDMEKPENNPARGVFNITGFPTLIYFEDGLPKYPFEGENTKDGLIAFVTNPTEPAPKQKEEEWAADTNSEIVHLTTSNFDLVLKEEKSAIVMFYANWCGHCKNLKPKYEEAAIKMKSKNIAGMLAALDATKEREIGNKFDVKGYPTLKYFENGEYKFDVKFRETDPIVKFMENPEEPPAVPEEIETSWEDEENDVVFLNDETFKSFLKKKKHCLVLFYAPWCFHCKKAKPEFIKAAEEYRDDPKVEFAAVDCTKHSGICSAYDVKGYPKIKYFNYLKTHKDYAGERKAEDFIKFMKNPDQEMLVQKPKEEVIPFTSDKVLLLNDKTFETTLKKTKSSLVMFFTNWCGHCKTLKPIYSKAAELAFEQGVPSTFAAIDCSASYDTCKQNNIEGYPTLKYFKNGKFFRDYSKQRTSKEMIQFLKSNLDNVDKEEL